MLLLFIVSFEKKEFDSYYVITEKSFKYFDFLSTTFISPQSICNLNVCFVYFQFNRKFYFALRNI